LASENENEKIELNPEHVKTMWECDDCGYTAECNLNFFSDGGIPYCAECDQDMNHKSTFVPLEYLQKINHDITAASIVEGRGMPILSKNSTEFD
jgi:hypothetical protein